MTESLNSKADPETLLHYILLLSFNKNKMMWQGSSISLLMRLKDTNKGCPTRH